MAAVGVALCAVAGVFGQQPSVVPALLQDRAVLGAIDAARTTEPQTIADQIRFCEVPAPPFKESARGEVLKAEFTRLSLQNVRVDRAGNVLGDRPGASDRPRVVVA